ncbi:MAG: alkaline phosphatase family protein, partial [Deltaproteobacteria bacterium]|nr:alkaline phosphatase family protein [Deltaproteobacteria bacterium]
SRPVATSRPAARRTLRVFLIDGLSLSEAKRLPKLSAFCLQGVDLTLDVGWPTVSLPVQHALWTGTWQTQSGVLFAQKRLKAPVFETLPQVLGAGGSLAIAQSHRYIVDSFRFSRVLGPQAGQPASTEEAFLRQARIAAQGATPLVFVHHLAVDATGHAHGARSPAYRAAARHADTLVGALASDRRPRETLAVLSDHGHLATGGHGGPEAEIRLVRACLVGPKIPARTHGSATIVDLSRIFADALGVRPPRHTTGRPLARVLARRDLPSQPPVLPTKGPEQLLLWLAAGALLTLVALRWRYRLPFIALIALPWATLATTFSVSWILGAPSLSRAWIYPAWPWLLWGLALVGVAILVFQQISLERLGIPPLLASWLLLLGILVPPLALLGISGFPFRIPPLVPLVSAWASVALAITMPQLGSLAIIVIWRDRRLARMDRKS